METQALNNISEITQLFDFSKVLLIALALLFVWGVNKSLRYFAEWTMQHLPSKRFIILQSATLFTFVWYFVAIYIIIALVIRPPKELLLALMGSLIVAMGFAMKDVAASIISGLILLFERPFQVGDRVNYKGTYGEVVSIGLRSVRLNTLSDDLVTIPNASFITDSVSTSNSGALEMMVVCDFHVALSADLDFAQSIIHEVVVTSRFVYMKKPIKFVVNEVTIAERLAVRIQAKAYVFDTRYEKQLQSDIYKRVSNLFNKHDVARPMR